MPATMASPITDPVPTTVLVPAPTAAAMAIRGPTAITVVGAPHAAVTGAAIRAREALFTNDAMSNASSSSGAMAMVGPDTPTAVPAATILAAVVAIDPLSHTAMAVSGAGNRHTATNMDHPLINTRRSRGPPRRFHMATTATSIEMPANSGRTIHHCFSWTSNAAAQIISTAFAF